MPPNDRTGPLRGPVRDTNWALGAQASLSETATGADIARGPSGDCCVLCGLVGIDLPLDHDCRPSIDVEAYRAQLTNSGRLAERWWSS
jgi:hypothetical protein